ncbi:hypothetical protein STEG23_001134, partial [Scotinomys teguina]
MINWMSRCRRLQIDPYLSPCTKLKSKWIKDLNINPVTLNFIEEKVGSTLEHIGTGDHFLNITPTAQTLSATINQWDCMKLRSFCKAKDTITKTKRQPTEWEKIFTNPTSHRGEQTAGFDPSACATKRLLWTYSVKGAEDLVLFCDLLELPKSQFSHISQLSPTHGPAHTPCSGNQDLSDVQWYMQPQSGGPLKEIRRDSSHVQNNGMLHILAPQMNKIPSYICRPRIRSPQDMACCVKTILELKPQRNASCGKPVENEQYLFLGSTGSISCPSLSCQSDAQSPEMTWYLDGRLLPEYKKHVIKLGAIYDHHQGLYVCDYTQSNNESSWTVRAVVQVRTIVKDTNLKPDILDPITDTLEVELGKSLTLPCKVQFGFQRHFKPVIRWYVKDSTQEQEIKEFEEKSIHSNYKSKVIEHTAFLREVTQRDLSKKFICFAQNSVGNTTRTIQLRKKEGVVFVYILLGTAMMLVGILVAAAFLYWYWIEIVLLCRAYKSKDETLRDKKEFDAFISYANRSSPESEATGPLSEEHLALNLFPEVLENKYGYTLCLLERDVTPGGEASSYVNESSNSTAQQASDARFAASSSDPDERISVFELDYDYVQIPYEVTLWILLASLAKIGFHLYHKLPHLMPESCLLIIVGALVGSIIFGTHHKSPPVMDSSIYFLYLLPPIVLESGYFMPTRPFFENIGSILWWAGLGALINAFGIGLSLYFICQIKAFGLGDINLLQNLLFGSLISAVDPVAVLTVFEEARVNEQLYMMIFGEALLNDGISVVSHPYHVPGLVELGGHRVILGEAKGSVSSSIHPSIHPPIHPPIHNLISIHSSVHSKATTEQLLYQMLLLPG